MDMLYVIYIYIYIHVHDVVPLAQSPGFLEVLIREAGSAVGQEHNHLIVVVVVVAVVVVVVLGIIVVRATGLIPSHEHTTDHAKV